jgi:putative intracellular protease/amidase
MTKKEVLLLLTDRWADWEASYAIAEINSTDEYTVKTIAVDTEPKASIGGIRAGIDYSIEEYQRLDDVAMLILPGGFSWGERPYDEIAAFVRKIHEAGIPVAAICGATLFLARHGFLDHIKHTGDELDYFKEKLHAEENYKGWANFVSAQLVADGGFITANETAALEFTREIFRVLEIGTREELDEWYDRFKGGMFRT